MQSRVSCVVPSVETFVTVTPYTVRSTVEITDRSDASRDMSCVMCEQFMSGGTLSLLREWMSIAE